MSGTISLRDSPWWERELEQVAQRFGASWGRVGMQAQGVRYLRGFMVQVDRKNGRQLAEHLVEQAPTISSTSWLALSGVPIPFAMNCSDTFRSIWRMPIGVLIVDEKGFLKKRTRSAGVARMSSGKAGRY